MPKTYLVFTENNHIQTDHEEEPYYDAIPDMPEPVKPKLTNSLLKKRQQSPPKQQPTEPSVLASNLASNNAAQGNNSTGYFK